jgi:hypothetical protein
VVSSTKQFYFGSDFYTQGASIFSKNLHKRSSGKRRCKTAASGVALDVVANKTARARLHVVISVLFRPKDSIQILRIGAENVVP